jgi:hypothetical protein
MRILVLTASFKSLIRRDPQMETKIAERLKLLVTDVTWIEFYDHLSLGLARGRSPYKNLNYWGRGNPPVVALSC